MLHEKALELIQKTAAESQKAEIVPIGGDGRKLLIRIGHELHEREVPPPVRAHTVSTLDALTDYAKKLDDPTKAVIWHAEDAIVLVLDDQDRRDIVSMPLYKSQPFLAASKLTPAATPLSQQDVIGTLRHLLGAPKEVVAIFRSVDFQRADGATGEVHHGKNTLGKSVNAQLVNADRVPEELRLSIPVFTNFGLNSPFPLTLNVDVDPVRAMFRLVVAAGGLEELMDQAQQRIAQSLESLLDDTELPVYRGRFSA